MSSRNDDTHFLLQTVLESMDEGFIAWSTDYKLVTWNQQFLDYWHYPAELMRVGLPLEELLEYQASLGTYGEGDIRELGIARKADVIAEFELSASGRAYEKVQQSPSGHWLRMRRRLVSGFGFVTWASDVTERYVADRAASLVHDNISSFPESIFMTDADNRVVFTNRRYHEIYPASPAKDEIIGWHQEDLIRRTLDSGVVEDPLARTDPGAWVAKRIAERRVEGTSTLETRHSNGRIYQIKQQRDAATGSIIITTDITDRIKADEALQESRDMLESRVEERTRELREEVRLREIASRAKTEFLANMSHELRTPLNAVLGFSETMQREVQGPLGNDKYREYAKLINDAGEHLLELINDVLDLAKVEAGQRDLHEEEIRLTGLFEWALRMIGEQADAKGHRLKTDLAGNVSRMWIYADERAMRQILLNLLSNAVKFTPQGGNIVLKSGLDELGNLLIDVIDDGPGIAEGDQERVMEPFSQAAPADTRGHEGTGLGLPLVNRLVEMHGGSFGLYSQPDTGTRVCFSLPASRCIVRSV